MAGSLAMAGDEAVEGREQEWLGLWLADHGSWL
jgi:hypothetical protein